MEAALAELSQLLEIRFSRLIHTSEDDIRYAFFNALQSGLGLTSDRIILEYPYKFKSTDRKASELDTYIPTLNDHRGKLIEIKYDREIPSDNGSPQTEQAAKLFNDIYKLCNCKIETTLDRYLVYVTDEEMDGYFNNPKNGFAEFYNLERGAVYTLMGQFVRMKIGKSKSFQKHLKQEVACDVSLRCIWSAQINQTYQLKVYQLLND